MWGTVGELVYFVRVPVNLDLEEWLMLSVERQILNCVWDPVRRTLDDPGWMGPYDE
jgi:hypothetical protein